MHSNVCVCVGVAELVYMLGAWTTATPVLCGLVAGLLHYAILATFAWMFMEGSLFFFHRV